MLIQGNLSNILFYENEPYLEFRDKALPLPEDIQLARTYIDLMRYKANNYNYVCNLEHSMMKINDNYVNMMKVVDKELEKYNLTQVETYQVKKKIGNNQKKLQTAFNSISLIKTIFSDMNIVTRDFINVRLRNKEDIMRIEEIGIDAHKKVEKFNSRVSPKRVR
jgi:hypothetical protein